MKQSPQGSVGDNDQLQKGNPNLDRSERSREHDPKRQEGINPSQGFFQNSRPGQNKKISQSQKVYYDEALPNVGNSCFLNSAVQLLYAAKQFRNELIGLKQKNEDSMTNQLGRLFKIMKDGGTRTEQAKLLTQILKKIDGQSPTYKYLSQEDAFETICQIFEALRSQQYSSFLNNYFRLRISLRCDCNEKKPIITEVFSISKVPERCSDCRQQFIPKFEKIPQYVILTGVKVPEKQLILGAASYGLVARVLYSGSGSYGHYTCIRENGKGLTLFSDQFTQKADPNLKAPNFSSDKMCLFVRDCLSQFQKTSGNHFKQISFYKIAAAAIAVIGVAYWFKMKR